MRKCRNANGLIIEHSLRASKGENTEARKHCAISLSHTEHTVFRLLALDRGLTFSELVRSTMVAAWGDEIDKMGLDMKE